MSNIDNLNIKPIFSSINSLESIDLSSNISVNNKVNMPFSFLNTDELEAIELALNGSIGFIDCNNSFDKKINLIKNIKQFINFTIKNPLTIRNTVNIDSVKNLILKDGIDCVLVANVNNQLLGIITKRDLEFAKLSKFKKTVSEIMTPFDKMVHTKNQNIKLDEVLEIISSNKVKKIPIIDNDNCIQGLITFKNIEILDKLNEYSSINSKNQLKCGALIDLDNDISFDKLDLLIKTGVDVIMIKHFHVFSKIFINKLKNIFSNFQNYLSYMNHEEKL